MKSTYFALNTYFELGTKYFTSGIYQTMDIASRVILRLEKRFICAKGMGQYEHLMRKGYIVPEM